MIPPYTGPALLRPHRTPIMASPPSRISAEGEIEDPFFLSSELSLPAEERTLLWVVRAPPYICCGGETFATNAEMVAHCRSWQHQKHVPEVWCDPRLLDPKGFAAASSYERYKRLHLFVTRMLGTFNDMEDPEKWDVCTRTSLDKMAQICRQWAFDRLPNEDEYDDEDSGLEELYDTIEGTTRELMGSVCVHDFGITAFRDSGVTGNALSLLTGGLSRFNPMEWGSCSCEQFMSSVYPDDEHPTYILHELCGYSSACGTPGCIFRDHHFGPHSNDGAEWVGE